MEEKTKDITCPHCGWVVDAAPESLLHLPPGTVLQGKYLIGRVLGQGGFGITYLAWDLNLNLKLAIKEYMPLDLACRTAGQEEVNVYKKSLAESYKYGLDKYLEEAQTLARFNDNPNTVNVSDFFRANGTAYMVMNYIDGINLKEYLAKQKEPLHFEKALEIFMPVLDALKEVHKAGLLHRDISPDNILITKNGRVVLIDFGAARQAVGDRGHTLSVIMKPGFSPEEQYHSRGKQGPWTDIYAVAASIYYTITGQAPPESLSRLSEDTMELPSALGFSIEPEHEAILLKAMSIKAKNRYQSIEEFQKALSNKLVVEEKPLVRTDDKNPTRGDFQHNINNMEIADNASVDWYIEDNRIRHAESSMSKANESNVVNLKSAAQQDKQEKESGNNVPLTSNRWLFIGSILVVAIIASVLLFSTSHDPKVSALYLKHNTLELESGSTVRLEVIVEPAGATVGELIWRSDNTSVADILGSDLVMPKDKGVATITVQDKETGIKDQCVVTVVYPTVTDYSIGEALYSGTLKNGSPHGQGTWLHPDGYEYEGEWKEGQWHGQGILTYPDWSKYEGGFKEGERHGRGSFTAANGNKFLFEYVNGQPTGTGAVVLPDGRTYEATYDKNDNMFYWNY